MNSPRLLFLENDTSSPTGILLDEANASGAQSDVLQIHYGNGDPSTPLVDVPHSSEAYDGIVIMGGPMGVYEDATYPFIEKTRTLIRDFHNAGKPVMGVCLGSQLVASVFGGKVWKMEGPDEFGFLPQTWEQAALSDPLLKDAEQGLKIFQWHHDTFALPKQAVRLATRASCPNQAFRLGDKTYAFQFHMELTRETIEQWIVERARATSQSVADIEKEIGPIDAALPQQQHFAHRVMRCWIDLVRNSRAP